MADSTDRRAGSEETSGHLCRYCPEPGADVCIGDHPSASGPGHAIHAHRACADERGIDVLYALVTEQATGSPS